MRQLHQKGITGQGISIAIVDQTLLVDHVEYRDRVLYYDDFGTGKSSSMYGPTVASIAVGKTTGVAPAANLFSSLPNFEGLATPSTFLHGRRQSIVW